MVSGLYQTWWWHTSKDECKWFIAIWFILLKQINKHDNGLTINNGSTALIIYTRTVKRHLYSTLRTLIVLTLCVMGPLRHAWLFFPSSSCSMRLLSPPLLAVNRLSCSPPGGAGPSLTPPSRVDPISLGFQAPSYLSVRYSDYAWKNPWYPVKFVLFLLG
jgi:hypothetical protein